MCMIRTNVCMYNTTRTNWFSTTKEINWKRDMHSLWKSIGMTNKDCESMVTYGENHELYKKSNVVSKRISMLREHFPTANMAHIIKIMPSILTDDMNIKLNEMKSIFLRHPYLQSKDNSISIDALINNDPFILAQTPQFINDNINNLFDLIFKHRNIPTSNERSQINNSNKETQVSKVSNKYDKTKQSAINRFCILISNDASILTIDANKEISVKYGFIKQYFVTRIENQICSLLMENDTIHKKKESTENEIKTDSENERKANADAKSTDSKEREISKYFELVNDMFNINIDSSEIIERLNDLNAIDMELIKLDDEIQSIVLSELDTFEWSLIRSPKLLLESDWQKFALIEYLNDQTKYSAKNDMFFGKKLSIMRLFELTFHIFIVFKRVQFIF